MCHILTVANLRFISSIRSRSPQYFTCLVPSMLTSLTFFDRSLADFNRASASLICLFSWSLEYRSSISSLNSFFQILPIRFGIFVLGNVRSCFIFGTFQVNCIQKQMRLQCVETCFLRMLLCIESGYFLLMFRR